MELVSVYLYNRIPIETTHVSNSTFHNLKRNGWYTDMRTNKKFTMLNKRIEANEQWYRAMIRFEHNGLDRNGREDFTLSIPCPFIVTECEPLLGETSKWKDTKTYHGPRLKSVQGLIQAGVPIDVIDVVYKDLEEFVMYN